MPEKSSNIELERFIPYYIRIIATQVASQTTARILKRSALSLSEWRVLVTVNQYPGFSVNDIAAKLGVDKPSTSRGATKLMRQGLLAKSPADQDQRVLALKLTVKGQNLYRLLAPQMLDFEKQMTAGLSGKDKSRLIEMLRVICANFNVPP